MDGKLGRSRRTFEIVLAAASLIYLVGFIFSLGPTLINDEYAAVDYIYRVVKAGHFFPTPDRLCKPLSMVFGLTGLFETVIPFEVINALFAALFAVYLFRFVSESLGFACAVIGFLLVFTNPDMLQYTVTGSMVMPFIALTFVAAGCLVRLEERPSLIWLYAVCFFLAGLLRPESWLFAAPLAVYFWLHREKIGWLRFILAVGIIELAPVIWFGNDLFINKNLFHSMDVALMVKIVGSGAQFTFWQALYSFPARLSNKLSGTTMLLGFFGMALFVTRRGWRGLLHPLLLFPALIFPYTFWVAYSAHPVHRYFYFLSVIVLIFAGYAWVWMFGLFREVKSRLRWIALLLLLAFAAAHCAYLPIKFKKDLDELRRDALIQKDMANVAEYLKEQIPEGRRPKIMIPSRRNEQLYWLFRDREIPLTLAFRKGYYLETYKGYWTFYLEPDWIVYFHGDFHFWGPQQMFEWLNYQDHTTLRGVRIDLVHTTDLARIFRVTYPPGWKEPPPEPTIP